MHRGRRGKCITGAQGTLSASLGSWLWSLPPSLTLSPVKMLSPINPTTLAQLFPSCGVRGSVLHKSQFSTKCFDYQGVPSNFQPGYVEGCLMFE